MLLERCQTLTTHLQQLETARQQQNLARSLQERGDELSTIASKFEAATRVAQVLLDAGLVTSAKLPDSSKAAGRLGEMRHKLSNNPQDLTKGQSFHHLRRAIEILTQQFSEVAQNEWKEYVATTAPRIDSKLLSHLRESTLYATTIAQIEDHNRHVKLLVASAPQSKDTLREIQGHWVAIRDLLRQLPVSDEPEVRAFLDAVISENGAPLKMLTESVRKWIEMHKMANEFCIRQQRS